MIKIALGLVSKITKENTKVKTNPNKLTILIFNDGIPGINAKTNLANVIESQKTVLYNAASSLEA